MASAQSDPFVVPKYYEVGQVLTLNVEQGSENPSCKVIEVKIVKLERHWTLSCGMIVEVLQPDLFQDFSFPTSKPIAFLKLFDRRHAHELRKTHKVSDWTDKIEKTCVEYVKSGKAQEFMNRLHDGETIGEVESANWNPAEEEIYLADMMCGFYNAETSAYRTLKDLQGQVVPRFFAGVNMDSKPLSIEPSSTADTVFLIKGILLQYLNGFDMDSLVCNVPRSTWQGIVDQALHAFHLIDSKELLNEDARPANFWVVPEGEGTYHVYMLDFALSETRGKNQSDKDWGKAKAYQDEEGAIGIVMKNILKKFDFELNYEPSRKYDQYNPFESEDEQERLVEEKAKSLRLGVEPHCEEETRSSSECSDHHGSHKEPEKRQDCQLEVGVDSKHE